MTSDEAVKQGRPGDNSDELDQAIDELRGVLKKGDDGVGEAPKPERASDKRPGTSSGGKTAGGTRTAGTTNDMSSASSKAFPDFEDDGFREQSYARSTTTGPSGTAAQLDLIMDIPIDVQVVLGTSRMPVSALLNLSEGSTIPLARRIGEPVEITVNGRLIGHGEITVLEGDDSRFGIRLTDVIKASRS